jgi:hypothetical protein
VSGRPPARSVRAASVTAMVWIALTMWLGLVRPAAQEETGPSSMPQLLVETVGIEPTVAMTGDILIATYRVRFHDLIAQGKEIVVIEDRMTPDRLPLAPFEAVGLEVEKHQIGSEHVWEFRYRLRIVAPKKDVLALRSLTFFYLIRDLGQPIEDARVLQAETMPLEVRYVTTMTGDPVLDIHDPVELGSFGNRLALLRGLAWVVAPLPLLLWSVGALRAARRRLPASREVAAFAPRIDVPAPVAAPPTVAQARRTLIRRLRRPAASAGPSDSRALLDFQRDVVIALRDYLLAEVPSLNPGDTAKEIRRHIETLEAQTPRSDVLNQLAVRLVTYQTALERGEPAPMSDPSTDGDAIEKLVSSLRWQGRLYQWTVKWPRS